MDQWKVLIQDRLPAVHHLGTLPARTRNGCEQNLRGQTTPGTPGRGASLLSGLLGLRRLRPTHDRRLPHAPRAALHVQRAIS